MTSEQIIAANQIVKEYEDLFYEKPIIVDMGDRKIILKRNARSTEILKWRSKKYIPIFNKKI